jgi:hypothetical protein
MHGHLGAFDIVNMMFLVVIAIDSIRVVGYRGVSEGPPKTPVKLLHETSPVPSSPTVSLPVCSTDTSGARPCAV